MCFLFSGECQKSVSVCSPNRWFPLSDGNRSCPQLELTNLFRRPSSRRLRIGFHILLRHQKMQTSRRMQQASVVRGTSRELPAIERGQSARDAIGSALACTLPQKLTLALETQNLVTVTPWTHITSEKKHMQLWDKKDRRLRGSMKFLTRMSVGSWQSISSNGWSTTMCQTHEPIDEARLNTNTGRAFQVGLHEVMLRRFSMLRSPRHRRPCAGFLVIVCRISCPTQPRTGYGWTLASMMFDDGEIVALRHVFSMNGATRIAVAVMW